MNNTNKQLGLTSGAEKIRTEYNRNPNHCLNCSQPMLCPSVAEKPGSVLKHVKAKKFCSRTCAATYNNKARKPGDPSYYTLICKKCGKSFSSADKRITRCGSCKHLTTSEFGGLSLAEVKNRYGSNWHSRIREHSRLVYRNSGQPLHCVIPTCEYTHYFEVAHLIAIESFSGSDTVLQMNNPANLLALCPNHHKDYDLGYLIFETGEYTIGHKDRTLKILDI